MSDGVGARSVAIEAVLLMLPGQIVKTGCKKGFVQSHQTVLPADELVRLGHILGFLAGIQWVTQRINSKKVTLSYPVQFGQVLVAIAGVEIATYVSCETSNSNAIVDAVWFDSTYPDTNIVHVIAIGR